MKHVVKYDFYLDVLLMVYIYVTKYWFLQETQPVLTFVCNFQPMLYPHRLWASAPPGCGQHLFLLLFCPSPPKLAWRPPGLTESIPSGTTIILYSTRSIRYTKNIMHKTYTSSDATNILYKIHCTCACMHTVCVFYNIIVVSDELYFLCV